MIVEVLCCSILIYELIASYLATIKKSSSVIISREATQQQQQQQQQQLQQQFQAKNHNTDLIQAT